uniref:PGG domain-containing protein n=1 Tax=Quercus lobata TaxID=97700 RepID=A0A7N2QX56_QUELO
MDERIEKLKQVAQHGNIDAFYMLIREDAKLLEAIDELPFVDTPLHIAASVGNIPFSMEMMRLKPSLVSKPNLDGFSPLHLALLNGKIEMVRRLLQVDGDLVRVKGKEGITLLHFAAAIDDHLDLLVEFLSVCPHSIEDVTIRNETALHIALKFNNLEAFKLLVGWLRQNRSKNAMFWERKVLNWKDDEGNTVLHVAVSKNQPKAVSHLLASTYDVDVNVKNLEGKTARDILQGSEQTQAGRKIKVMLHRAKALKASSLPKVTSYADYLRPKVGRREKFRIRRTREQHTISDERRNVLLVVATLLMIVTYQGILSPPGGLWQDDYNPGTNESNTIAPNGKINTTLHSQEAGAVIGSRKTSFGFFMLLNSVTFMLSFTIIFQLIPSGYCYVMFQAALCFLYFCYLASLTVIKASTGTGGFLISGSALLYNIVDVKLLEDIDQLPFVDTPLDIAASAGHIPMAMELMRLIPSFSWKPNPDGFSPIHLDLLNGQTQMVLWLLKIDGDLEHVQGREGMTPLHYAATTDIHLELLDEFLKVCPQSIKDVTIQNENALHIALKYDKLEAFLHLVRRLQKNWSQNTIMWESNVLKWKDEEANTALHIAVSKNQPKAVRKLLYSGVDKNTKEPITVYQTCPKNLKGNTAGDMLGQQNQIENRKIKVMLRHAGALPASSLPKVIYYARYLWSLFSYIEKIRMHCIGEWTEISDDRCNMLLVVATLLLTVTYQGVLSPLGGLWQDEYHPEPNTT